MASDNSSSPLPAPSYFGAKTDAVGRHFIVGVRDDGAQIFKTALPGRGHSIAIRPAQTGDRRDGIVFARRPGRFALVFNCVTGEKHHIIRTAPGRHFYGHGVFSPDGATLFTTENDYENGRGIIGVRDATNNYRPIGEIFAGGIGPHEIALLRDGRTLVVANGGILTYPDAGRRKLNIPTMSPSLAYLDSSTGALKYKASLPKNLNKLSIRHLSVDANDNVAIALQYQGPKSEIVPLVAIHKQGENLKPMAAPPAILKRMRNYCGGVCLDTGQTILAVTSPRGNLTTFWSIAENRYVSHVDIPDGSGVAPTRNAFEFMFSSGAGDLYRYNARTGSKMRLTNSPLYVDHWDNHLKVSKF